MTITFYIIVLIGYEQFNIQSNTKFVYSIRLNFISAKQMYKIRHFVHFWTYLELYNKKYQLPKPIHFFLCRDYTVNLQITAGINFRTLDLLFVFICIETIKQFDSKPTQHAVNNALKFKLPVTFYLYLIIKIMTKQ